MSYATAAKVRHRLPVLGDPGDDADLDARIAEGIVWGDGICDSYLAKLTTVPMADPPEVVLGCANDLAAAFCVRSAFSGGGETKSPSLYDTLYNGAVDRLKAMVAGDLGLPVDEEADVDELPLAETGVAYHSEYGQTSTVWEAEW